MICRCLVLVLKTAAFRGPSHRSLLKMEVCIRINGSCLDLWLDPAHLLNASDRAGALHAEACRVGHVEVAAVTARSAIKLRSLTCQLNFIRRISTSSRRLLDVGCLRGQFIFCSKIDAYLGCVPQVVLRQRANHIVSTAYCPIVMTMMHSLLSSNTNTFTCLIILPATPSSLSVHPRPIILSWHFTSHLLRNVLPECLVCGIVLTNSTIGDHSSIVRIEVAIQSALCLWQSSVMLLDLHLRVLHHNHVICWCGLFLLVGALLLLRALVLVHKVGVHGSHRVLKHKRGIWMELLLHQVFPNVVV